MRSLIWSMLVCMVVPSSECDPLDDPALAASGGRMTPGNRPAI